MSNYKRDQNGVVWFGFEGGPQGMTSREGYEYTRTKYEGLPKYEDLEVWDSHQQNMIDVD